jgi:hypothetical protein
MPDVYCTAPWRGLHLDTTGDIKVCCAGRRNAFGNLNSSTIHEIFASNELRQVRQQILDGQQPQYCAVCTESERHGGQSERHWHLEIDKGFVPESADEHHAPSIIDVRWNNTCNLKCAYCNGISSSKWAQIEGKPVESAPRRYYDQVAAFVRDNGQNLTEVAMVGGEPLLLLENAKFLDIIPPHVKIVIITNLSVDLDKNVLFQKLRGRPNVSWSLSFENIESRFEFVRDGADWHRMVNNIALINELRQQQNHTAGIHAVLNIFSITRLTEIMQFAKSQGLTIMWQTLTYPQHFDPFLLGPEVADRAMAEIESVLSQDCSDQDHEYFSRLRHDFAVRSPQSQLEQFRLAVMHRRQQFKQLWPELDFLIT